MNKLNKKACKDINSFKEGNGDTVLINLMLNDANKLSKVDLSQRLVDRTKFLEQKADNLRQREKHDENLIFKDKLKGDYETADDIYLDVIKSKLNMIKYT